MRSDAQNLKTASAQPFLQAVQHRNLFHAGRAADVKETDHRYLAFKPGAVNGCSVQRCSAKDGKRKTILCDKLSANQKQQEEETRNPDHPSKYEIYQERSKVYGRILIASRKEKDQKKALRKVSQSHPE